MSLGVIFDRIPTDVASKLAANVNVPELIIFLINDFYYFAEIQQCKIWLLHLMQGLQSLIVLTDATVLSFYLRRVVATASASPMSSILIEAKYLTRFGP